MDQFSNSDNSGMVGFLVGIIVLVFAGILFSLMADKRFSFSSSKISLEQQIAEEKTELESVKARLESARKHWREECEPLSGQGSAAQSIAAEVKANTARLAALPAEKDAAKAELSAATASFEDYRSRYRQQARAAAVGEHLDELKSRSGKVYKDVTIRRVSSTGLEIRHEHGPATLQPEDLDATWQDRFQWSREEIAKARDEQRANQERHDQAVGGSREDDAGKPASPAAAPNVNPATASPGGEKLQTLREQLIEARTRYRTAQSEASRARIEASGSGRDRSPPGSLETWSQRATRLESAASKLRGQYMTARGKLSAAAPGDALLITEEP